MATISRYLGTGTIGIALATAGGMGFCSPLHASPLAIREIQTRVFKLEVPAEPTSKGNAEAEVLSSSDGRVYFAPLSDQPLLGKLKSLAEKQDPAVLKLDQDRVIDAQPLLGAPKRNYIDALDQPGFEQQALAALRDAEGATDAASLGKATMPASYRAAEAQGYDPTILASYDDAARLFASERELKHKSECYERAEVWAREMERGKGVRSMKVFMFFTDRFRHRYTHKILGIWTRPYKWWFHVAPFVYVGGQEYVLDREFMRSAVTMEDWTFEFIGKVHHDNHDVPNPTPGEAHCLDASSYDVYSHGLEGDRYCVLRKVPMYYFQPEDVESMDHGRGVMGSWRASDLKRAYEDTWQ